MPRYTGIVTALAGLVLGAQDLKINGLVTLWWTQMGDRALRTADLAGSRVGEPGAAGYYPLHAGFRENGLVMRRTELYLQGRVSETVTWNVAMDPNFGGNIVSDATVMWECLPGMTLRVGQFKPLQGYEGTLVFAPQLLFYDRGILARQFGDKWDRGATLTWRLALGGMEWRLSGGVFNGAGRAVDANGRKDVVARLDGEARNGWRMGLYGLVGKTDAPDKGLRAFSLGDGGPDEATVLTSGDRTTHVGAYLVFERGAWHASVEALGGRLGRRFPVMGTGAAGNAQRQGLDQAFWGIVLTGAHTMGRHTLTARWEWVDYNANRQWPGNADPYRLSSGDWRPRFTEAVAGWNVALGRSQGRSTNLKVNHILRRGPILIHRGHPEATDSLVLVFQVGF